MQELILSVRLKNAIKKANRRGFSLKFSLRNIIINGSKRGCSGFVTNLDNGSIVYIDTDISFGFIKKYLYRYANDEKDFVGYHNRFAESFDDLVEHVIGLLAVPVTEAKDEFKRKSYEATDGKVERS